MATRDTQFKDLDTKQKIEHIWEYYRGIILFSIFGAVLLGFVVYNWIHPGPKPILYTVLSNAGTIEVDEEDNFFENYMDKLELDREKEEIMVRTNVYISRKNESSQERESRKVLYTLVAVGEVDVIVGNTATFEYMGVDILYPVEEILPPELLDTYKDRFYTLTSEETGEELVCGIWLEEGNVLMRNGYYQEPVMVGICNTGKNPEAAKAMILELLKAE